MKLLEERIRKDGTVKAGNVLKLPDDRQRYLRYRKDQRLTILCIRCLILCIFILYIFRFIHLCAYFNLFYSFL